MGIRKIAQIAGVSVSTVSRVLNGTKPVSDDLRERVEQAIQDVGYVPDYVARSMVLKKSFTVGVIMPNTSELYHQAIFYSIEKVLDQYGYKALLCLVKDPDDAQHQNNESGYLEVLVKSRTDGIIMMHESSRPEIYSRLHDNTIPMVQCNIDIRNIGYPQVRIDDFAAAYDGTSYLLGLGHTNIGVISTVSYSMAEKRIGGYRKALADHGIQFDKHRIIYSEDGPAYTRVSFGAGKAAMRQLLDTTKGVTAVFVMSDEMAVGAFQAVREAGLSIPHDISILGFDGIELGAFTNPQLTSIEQPIGQLGTIAAKKLMAMISGNTIEQDEILRYQLRVRSSCRNIS
ncbi:LacI family DNA-binding transcriptional regulator [Sediminispirochaeta smaragdinae]|uniref:Transcriptional regulator, LacI family n=1 Tax=Sediminispirochaeta smaragdinae (strain DSM 11293 / JCM 15392 / SEBR 4228) TaxID=573413 RepID=E1RC43_SEDSS|nr:LacI family DNA-binding transcriptional regulator [Sediminispirochaeta smaragdinae]ADK79923.1 transcriptional regulator, LacI family [Sediminispirochaeta smaragdinae DSM 11293]